MLGREAQESDAVSQDSFAMPSMELQDSHSSEEGLDPSLDDLTKRQAYCLFISHMLSMWNSRMYEFGVVRTLERFLSAKNPRHAG